MEKRYPFKFLDAYTKEDKDIFFGREAEADALYRMVFQTNLLLVYGPSGTGKTSLIRSGLANRFKPTQWLDLYIRRGDDINQSSLDTVVKQTLEIAAAPTATVEGEMDWFESLLEEEESQAAADEAPPAVDSENPVAQALHELYLRTFTPIYLIFDQFEELYTLGHKQEQQKFIQTISELMDIPLPLKIIIVIREEYLGRLYELEKAVPQLRDKKLRVEAMDQHRVEQVILKATADNPNSNIELEAGQETAIARTIIEKVREQDVDVKLPYLQVFMDRLYETATGEPNDRRKAAHFTLELVTQTKEIGDVLADFVERQSQRVYRELSKNYDDLPTDVVWRILSPFATVDGTKSPIQQQGLSALPKTLDLPASVPGDRLVRQAIVELENSRILRYRKEEDTYELVHDSLALKVAEKRSEDEKAYLKARRLVTEGYATYLDTHSLLSREQLVFIKPYEVQLREDINSKQRAFVAASKRKLRRQLWLQRSGVVVLFAAAILVIAVVRNAQKEAEALLSAKERTELDELLQNAGQIAKGDNCPPEQMLYTMDSLYHKQPTDDQLQKEYQSIMQQLNDCY
jgi:hypothetical protein